MIKSSISLCKVADTCMYGGKFDGAWCCDFWRMNAKSRVIKNPNGEIVDGKCGEYKETTDEGKRRRKALRQLY